MFLTQSRLCVLVLLSVLLSCDLARACKHSQHRSKRIPSLSDDCQETSSGNGTARSKIVKRQAEIDESSLTTPEVITARGYPVEIHRVTTEDGYILELHRIPPRKKGKRVVFLQHGFIASSATWLSTSSDRSFAITLAEKGYDVWMGNSRGTRYSRDHVNLDPRSAEFWDYSWDEMGKYDVPATINYVLRMTGRSKLSYVGYSLGSTTYFIAMITHPELNSKVDIMIAIAPFASCAHFPPTIQMAIPLAHTIDLYLRLTGTREFLGRRSIGRRFLKFACERSERQTRFCSEMFNINVPRGRNNNLSPTLNPIPGVNFLEDPPSLHVAGQYVQNYRSGEVFQAYDFGEEGNMERYGSSEPLVYNLQKITSPIYIISGDADDIVTYEEIAWISSQLPKQTLKGSIRLSGYDHLDFIRASDVREKVIDNVLRILPPPV